MKLFLSVILILSFECLKAQACFSVAPNLPLAGYGACVISADFNKDGFSDLAVANGDIAQAINRASVFIGNGDGSFVPAANYVVGSGPASIVASDFNNDGNLDLATANYSSDNISRLLGNGSGSFGAALNFSIGNTPSSLISYDFNGDGNKDIVAVNDAGTGRVYRLLGSGTGSFGGPVQFPAGSFPGEVACADYDGDGDYDLSCATSNGVAMLRGNANGGFALPGYLAGGTNPSAILTADLNNDGYMDIATANIGTDNVTVYLNDGTGFFVTSFNAQVGDGPGSITHGDFNGDGYMDLVTANWSGNNVSVILGTGDWNFGVAFSAPINISVGTSPNSVCTGDYNNDGRPDLAIANYGSKNVRVLVNTTPFLTVVSSSSLMCAGSTVTISVTGANGYVWSTSATSSSIVVSPANTTTYSVTGDNNVCTSTIVFSQKVEQCLSTEGYDKASDIIVHPNPNGGEFTLSVKNSVINKVDVFDSKGSLLLSKEMNNSADIKFSELTEGFYILHISTDNGIVFKKVIVVK